MGPSFPLGIFRFVPVSKSSLFGHTMSFIDQTCSVEMAEYWPRFFCVFIDLEFVSVDKKANNIEPS